MTDDSDTQKLLIENEMLSGNNTLISSENKNNSIFERKESIEYIKEKLMIEEESRAYTATIMLLFSTWNKEHQLPNFSEEDLTRLSKITPYETRKDEILELYTNMANIIKLEQKSQDDINILLSNFHNIFDIITEITKDISEEENWPELQIFLKNFKNMFQSYVIDNLIDSWKTLSKIRT